LLSDAACVDVCVSVVPGETACEGLIVDVNEDEEVGVGEGVADEDGVPEIDGDELAEPVTLGVDVGLAAHVSLSALRRTPRYAVTPAQL